MPNYWGRMGAPMIQPTKDELREIISEQRDTLASERAKVLSLTSENTILKKRLALAEKVLGKRLIDAEMRKELEQKLVDRSI